MKVHHVQQGSAEWLQLRASHFTASEAPAMAGCSPYMTRTELLKLKHTGLAQEVEAGTQRLFDKGHETEAMFRPHAEAIIEDDLYPITGSEEVEGLPLLASFDGLTMDYSTGYEHKLWSEANATAITETGEPPVYHCWQLEQQLLVSGADRILFVTSDGTAENAVTCWYESKPERRAALIAGWKQFKEDLAAFVPSTVEVKPVGRTPDNLPALRIEVTGAVTASNLAEYKTHALEVFKGINRELTTDQHFADAEKVVKWCGDVESRLAAAKEHALSQTATIDTLFKAIDDISAEARRTRLELDKLVKARKEQIREEIVADGRKALAEHISALNTRLGKSYMPQVLADFAGAIKGKRTVESLRDAVSTTLANAKIDASATADRIQSNLGTLRELAADHTFLFADAASIVLKQPDDLTALVKSRIADHAAAEAKRLEAERERIRAEEQSRIEREQREAAAAEQRKHEAEEQAARAQAEQQAAAETARLLQQAQEQTKVAPVSLVAANNAAKAEIAADAAPANDEPATLKLGDICARIGITMTAAFVSDTLGIAASGTDKRAVLYRESQFSDICDALIDHIGKAKACVRLAA